MALTNVEKEKINDSVLKIQSVRASLENIDENKIPDFREVRHCLSVIDKNLQIALRETHPN